ncbi:hypothetical protein [Leptodesmis sp.]|uniref:hypothetical protein n=1 Tax=Leptodesmis sp. TaxID=3100501 RepID=UPI0040535142
MFALEGLLVTQVIVALANTRRRIQLSQEALYNAYADLEQRVHDRTIQLSQANQQLQQQIAERDKWNRHCGRAIVAFGLFSIRPFSSLA